MRQRVWLFAAVGMATLPVLALAGYQASPEVTAITASFKPFAPKVRTRADARNFYVESDGIPDHPMMVGITAWQQQVPLPQPYTGQNAWQFPLKPIPAAQPLSAKNHFFRGAIAIAADGVPIFNALNNRGVDSNLAGELDEYGGHSGRADDYHYHAAPLYLEKIVGRGKPIGYALDGYPLYGLTEPGGSPTGKLDEFNGHTTPELGYHYHATKTYPYINGGFHGAVTEIGGQVDPQPRAEGVRGDTPPLPGAKITAFVRPAPGKYSLTYVIHGNTCKVNYRLEADGSYTFDYVAPTGKVETLRYETRPQRPGRPQRQAAPEFVAPAPTDFQLTSAAVTNGGSLPATFTCDGESVSPPVAWKNPPTGTRSFALVMHHIPPGDEAPHVYWIVHHIPANLRGIPQNDSHIGVQGGNTINRQSRYAPPCSQGPGKKWYTLTLYALSGEPELNRSGPVTRDTLLEALKGKILNSTVLNVSYERSER